jgi:hypothetical protein
MRCGHGGAAGIRVCTIAGIAGRTSVCAWGGDIWFYPAATIDSNRAAAAKGSSRIATGNQRPNAVRCVIDPRWIDNCGTGVAGITSCHYHHDASGALSFHSSLQRVSRTTFRRRTTPGVNRNVRRLGRVALPAAYWIRRQEKFHALDIRGRCAIALVHVTASDPLCAGRHSDLIAGAIVTDCRASGVRAVKEIIARKR